MTAGTPTEHLELHRDPFFCNFTIEGSNNSFSEKGHRRALNRLRWWMSKGEKPKLEDLLLQANAAENAATSATEEDMSRDILHVDT
jgi:hypothetical protein